MSEFGPKTSTGFMKLFIRNFVINWVIRVILCILSIIPCVVAIILIKLTTNGPVFYTQTRVGKDGKKFQIWKFRSMVEDAEKFSGPIFAGENDPRTTWIGKYLRKFRIDELPQLWCNVGKDMDLIGPRPERPEIVEKLIEEIPEYQYRQRVKPGLTGWAQINQGYADTTDCMRKKLYYDLEYINNQSIKMDLQILAKTVSVVLLGEGQ